MARKTGSHAEQTGPKVREAALRLFAEFGYAAVSMRQIAREVGVQAGALYTYTPDKQALLFDLLRSHMVELMAAWNGQAGQGGSEDAMAGLERFVRFHIAHHLDRADAVFISYMELRNLSAQNFEVIEGHRRRYEQALEGILEAGQRSGQMNVQDPRLTAMAIIAMLTGVTTWFRDGGRLSREQVADSYWAMVRGMVLDRAGAAQVAPAE